MTPLEQAAADYAEAVKDTAIATKMANLAREKADVYYRALTAATDNLNNAQERLLSLSKTFDPNNQ